MARRAGEPIAIVGSGCRFPGGINSPSKLWDMLREPRDVLQEIPKSRFDVGAFYNAEGSGHGCTDVKHAYLLDDPPGAFDAAFFGIKPLEARAMDPQQRLLLEVAYEALESAGFPIEGLRGTDTGVYVGAMSHDYSTLLFRDVSDLPTYAATGTAASILSNRISHVFDLKGPSVTVDTACSSSMVAVHLAVQALRSGDSRAALVCGANVILGPEVFVMESRLGMLSPEGRCRMWDEGANGYARGEGVGVLVLKTLRAALEDGDRVEGVIRETALNQDGASGYGGITMPSPVAQEALIRAVYAKAGLELGCPADEPQYFEAHGTGTPAGDPAEAEAIYRALGTRRSIEEGATPLYVGSIKTVLGHAEGAAGVAAVMKASLALRHGVVPPNLLFDRVSRRVAPFYRGVEVVTEARPWPRMAKSDGEVRRASVNSFGFGGTNSHAILENYEQTKALGAGSSGPTFTPCIFSASSEESLRRSLRAYLEFLNWRDSEFNLGDLAWTLRKRRSVLSQRAAITVPSMEGLKAGIEARIQLASGNGNVGVKSLPPSRTGRILGVFTGQGAQYARMGAELIEASDIASAIIEKLETSLQELSDGPDWSLKAELLAGPSVSRIGEAAISQPLCTAVQIMLVDLVRLAGVEFDAVVGHSSGEIAAAYAAGRLSARDAMRVAYYRGMCVSLARSPNGGEGGGAMLAVGGSSAEDLEELCQDPVFEGRIGVAAFNSPTSFTLSGDEDAVEEMETLLEDEGTFHKRLRVDRAYHSEHMLPCAGPYVERLTGCGLQTQLPPSSSPTCKWISSVSGKPVDTNEELAGSYWVENMVHPVLFHQAVEQAVKLSGGAFDLVLEIGGHPALSKPCQETIKGLLQREVPYTSLLRRGTSALEASSAALGFAWERLEAGRVDLDGYERALSAVQGPFRVVEDIPSYNWDHETEHWHESRASRVFRIGRRSIHHLLGTATADSAAHHMSWRNMLRVGEMEWMTGHRVQGQVVFPAAGYLATALEAARCMAAAVGHEIRLIEVQDFMVRQAIVFEPEDVGIEVLVQLTDVTVGEGGDRVRARFTYSASLPSNPDKLTLAAEGMLDVLLAGNRSPSLLPAPKPALSQPVHVATDSFYKALAGLGYQFNGPFRSLTELKRRHRKSSCVVMLRDHEDLLVHPAELDSMLQSCILAYSHPQDGSLRSLHLPSGIRRLRVNPAALHTGAEGKCFMLQASIRSGSADCGRGICGDASLSLDEVGSHEAIQIQGASFLPLGSPGEEQDDKVFSKTHWVNMSIDEEAIYRAIPLTEQHHKTAQVLERIAIFYLRQFDQTVASDDPVRSQHPLNHYVELSRHFAALVEAGKHKWARPEWLGDTREILDEAAGLLKSTVDVEMMHLVGEQMPHVFRGETTMLQEFRRVDILDRYYAEGYMLKESAQWVSQAIRQIADRYPHMNILELGAGTGGATKEILRRLGSDFRSYTYTDISPAFFDAASQALSQHGDRIIFKTLDAEREPVEQGFAEGAYDLVVAFFVAHATSDLGQTLRNARTLLRPGGFLVLGEGLGGIDGLASSGFIFGGLPGWWLGAGREGRRADTPHVAPEEWNRLLRSTGFSGADFSVSDEWKEVLSAYSFVAQAVDETVRFLREPLAAPLSWKLPPVQDLFIVGGRKDRSLRLLEGIIPLFKASELVGQVHAVRDLASLDWANTLNAGSAVLSLTDLDEPFFREVTPSRFEAFKRLFEHGRRILWVTSGRLETEPLSNMVVGFGRVAVNEMADLRLQQLDVSDDSDGVNPRVVAEAFLRFYASEFQEERTLWSFEPEIVLDARGKGVVPRLRTIPDVNDRYNSAKRTIVRTVNVRESSVTVRAGPRGFVIGHHSPWEISASQASPGQEDGLELRTLYAIMSAVRTSLGPKFLVLGECPEDGIAYLALASSLDSVLRVARESAVPIELELALQRDVLVMVAVRLVASTALDSAHSGQTVIVHNATESLDWAFAAEAAARDVHLVFVADSLPTSGRARECLVLPEFATDTDLLELLPAEPIVFVSLDSRQAASAGHQQAIVSSLPPYCRVETASTLFFADGVPYTGPTMRDLLERALHNAKKGLKENRNLVLTEYPTVSLTRLAQRPPPSDPLSIIDFSRDVFVPVEASRLDARPLFKAKNGTYWIAGMTGVLGISLCEWMLNNGARHIAMTSRRPDVDPEWVASQKRKGATVLVLSCDLTNEADVVATYGKICQSLPPVAGVMNGAMVLQDVVIRNMTYEQLVGVTRPKVDGSIYLDRLFHDTNLDFFVLVSSINCLIGNWGQANYAAANMFMCGLAAHRRKRGLRAAAANVGAIIGAGYMERESRRGLELIVEKLHLMRLSEEDWHQIMAEAVDASRLEETAHGPEITAGFSHVPSGVEDVPVWFKNPAFGEFVLQDEKVIHGKSESQEVGESLQDMLRGASSLPDVEKIVKEAFCSQLRSILKVAAPDADLMAARSSEIGLDSLVALDMQTWILRSLQVNVPVLKIMGNQTMSTLVGFIVQNMAPEMQSPTISNIPKLDTEVGGSDSGVGIMSNSPSLACDDEEMEKQNAAEFVDWETEVALPADWALIPTNLDVIPPRSPPQVVVLTGVTGLLGHHLLDRLLEHPSLTTVHCLAVRGLETRLRNGQLRQDKRIVYHAGDLVDALLGLSENEAELVFAAADAVIHNGADTSHVKTYQELRGSNVGSTRTLARLCLDRRIPLHYVSSAGVALYAGRDPFPAMSASSGPRARRPAPDGTFGYGASKWVSERVLEDANAQLGLPVRIHRPSTIMREGEDGDPKGARARLDWVNALLAYVRLLGAAPEVRRNRGALDMVRVETCCKGILEHVFGGGEGLQHVHEVGDVVVPLDCLGDLEVIVDEAGGHKEEYRGRRYCTLPMHEWTAKAIVAGLHPGVALLIEEMDGPDTPDYPRLLKNE